MESKPGAGVSAPHWHSVCGRDNCTLLIAIRGKDLGGFFVDISHSVPGGGHHTDSCKHMLPSIFVSFMRQLGEACRDDRCPRTQQDSGILV